MSGTAGAQRLTAFTRRRAARLQLLRVAGWTSATRRRVRPVPGKKKRAKVWPHHSGHRTSGSARTAGKRFSKPKRKGAAC